VRNAETLEGEDAVGHETEPCVYRLGGNSCLSGDFMGYWRFNRSLKVGDTIIFEDMIHYTTVKTNMFNGIHHPSLALLHLDGTLNVLRNYQYEDYRDRMD
jgi:carboxynorspermidine decarboxylase